MNSERYDSRNANSCDRHFRLCLSRRLKDPAYGNITFLYKDSNEEISPRLFAFSHIWEHSKFADCGICRLDRQADRRLLILVSRTSWIQMNQIHLIRHHYRHSLYLPFPSAALFPSSTTLIFFALFWFIFIQIHFVSPHRQIRIWSLTFLPL